MNSRLFAVYLGGRAAGCNTELHDVVFAVGENIQATYEQLLDEWFGDVDDLHLDSWLELDIADGHKIAITENPPNAGKSLYFINLGAYADGVFGELHANCFLVATSKQEAKARAKLILSKKLPGHVHTDDLHDVDDCIELRRLGRYFIEIEATNKPAKMQPVNGYHVIPEAIIQHYAKRTKV